MNKKEVEKAYERIKKHIIKTPLVKSHVLSSDDKNIYFKLESFQYTNAFKFRGALNKAIILKEENSNKKILACSSGNHAQGISLAASMLGLKADIYMPSSAPNAKVEGTRKYGANVILCEGVFDDAKRECLANLDENSVFVSPFNDPDIISGQGSIAIEILDQLDDVDTILIPIGGGGALSGISSYIKEVKPNVKIIGVEPENAASMKASVEAKKIVPLLKGPSLADGCLVEVVGDTTFEIALKNVDYFVSVSEEEIKEAVILLAHKHKLMIEGAGACTTAALIGNKIKAEDIINKNVVLLVTGANIDINKFKELV